MTEQIFKEEELEYIPRILVFYSKTCMSCIKKLGLDLDGVTQKRQTVLTKTLSLMERMGFEVIRFDITDEGNKARLLSATARGESYLPVIITAFALLENPPARNISDLVDALLGLKTLPPETGHEKVQA
jgi:hypothetical protein